jgi:hypothetical protein
MTSYCSSGGMSRVDMVATRHATMMSYCTRSGGMLRDMTWPEATVLLIPPFTALSDSKLHNENKLVLRSQFSERVLQKRYRSRLAVWTEDFACATVCDNLWQWLTAEKPSSEDVLSELEALCVIAQQGLGVRNPVRLVYRLCCKYVKTTESRLRSLVCSAYKWCKCAIG